MDSFFRVGMGAGWLPPANAFLFLGIHQDRSQLVVLKGGKLLKVQISVQGERVTVNCFFAGLRAN